MRSKKSYEIVISETRKMNLLGMCNKIYGQKFLVS